MTKSSSIFNWSWIVLFLGIFIAGVFWILDSLIGSETIFNFPLTLEYYPAFIATAMGVFFALILQEAMTSSKQEKRMDEMQKILRKEIQRIHDLAAKKKGNHLDTQVWDSLIYSGDVSLLPPDLQDELFEVYFLIKALNIESKRARDAAEAKRLYPFEDTQKAHLELSIRINEKESELCKIIHDFLQSNKLKGS